MRSYQISELIEEKITGEWGDDPVGEDDVAVIRTANFTNLGTIDYSKVVFRNVSKKKIAAKRLKGGDVIIEKSGGSPTQPVGRVVIFERESTEAFLCNNFTAALRPKRDLVFPKYFLYSLSRLYRTGRVLRHQNKTTGIINLKLDSYLEEKVSLPPLDDQKRIVHLLSKVEGLIAQRKQHLQQLDALLKSVFLEMFGIDRIAENDWLKVALGSKTQIVSGVTKGKRYADQAVHEVPYMRVANVQDGHLNLSEIKTIEVSEEEIERYQLRRGDLLLTEGGDPDKLGRGALWSDEIPGCIHQNHIFRVRTIDDSINPKFLSALIGSKYGKSYFLKAAKQTTGIASINSTQLKSFPLIIPPIDLQNKFAAIVEKVEGLKTRYQQSLADLEALYGTLSQKAFAGDLDLSRVRLQGAEA